MIPFCIWIIQDTCKTGVFDLRLTSTSDLLQRFLALAADQLHAPRSKGSSAVDTLLGSAFLMASFSTVESLLCEFPEGCLGCRMKSSNPLAVDASTKPCAADRRGLLLGVGELNALERLVTEEPDEVEDHGLLLVDGMRASTATMVPRAQQNGRGSLSTKSEYRCAETRKAGGTFSCRVLDLSRLLRSLCIIGG